MLYILVFAAATIGYNKLQEELVVSLVGLVDRWRIYIYIIYIYS